MSEKTQQERIDAAIKQGEVKKKLTELNAISRDLKFVAVLSVVFIGLFLYIVFFDIVPRMQFPDQYVPRVMVASILGAAYTGIYYFVQKDINSRIRLLS